MLIYVIAPYSNGDTIDNIRQACQAGEEIWKKGHIPLIPHLTYSWHLLYPKSWEEWMRICLTYLGTCGSAIRLKGESKGGDIEVAEAKNLRLPVYYSLEEIPYKEG